MAAAAILFFGPRGEPSSVLEQVRQTTRGSHHQRFTTGIPETDDVDIALNKGARSVFIADMT